MQVEVKRYKSCSDIVMELEGLLEDEENRNYDFVTRKRIAEEFTADFQQSFGNDER